MGGVPARQGLAVLGVELVGRPVAGRSRLGTRLRLSSGARTPRSKGHAFLQREKGGGLVGVPRAFYC